MTNPVIYAAAYLLLAAAPPPASVDGVRPITQPQAIRQPSNHLTIRWIGDRHRHHHRHQHR